MTLENRDSSRSVRNIRDYLFEVSRIRRRLDGGQDGSDVLAFRGQRVYCWKLQSSAERRLKNSPSGPDGVINADFIEYHQDLILACRTNRFDRRDGTPLEDLEVLADLQHHMAATCLIDFTRSALVALWFACEESGKDGKVFVVNTADEERFLEVTRTDITGNSISKILTFRTRVNSDSQTEESAAQDGADLAEEGPKFWRWTPASLNQRIPAQHSFFVFGPLSSGMPETEEIIIESARKEEIREELKDVHDIYEATLFPDFAGFAYTHRHEALYGPSAAEHYRLGLKAQQRGERPQVAIEHFNNAIQLKSDDPRSYRFRGRAYERQREFDNAIKDYSKAIELNPKIAMMYELRARVHETLREFDKAIQDYTTIIDLRPESARPYRFRGRAYEMQGKLNCAISDYSTVIEMDPEDPRPYRWRGEVYVQQREFETAIGDYSTAIKLHPEFTAVYYRRGEAYLQQGEFETAIQDYSTAIELNSSGSRYYASRAVAQLCLERWTQAKSDFTVAGKLGLDVAAFFQREYGSVEDFASKMNIQIPKDIESLLTPEDPLA